MAGATMDRAVLDKQIEESSAPMGDSHHDVEVGGEAVDVARIEKVYE